MSEFRTFILESAIPYVLSSPPLFFGLIGMTFLYFGHLYNEAKIKEPRDKIYNYVYGFSITFGTLLFYLLLILFIPKNIFIIENNKYLTFLKMLALFYVVLVILITTKKLELYENKFTYDEAELRNYPKIEPAAINKSLILPIIKRFWPMFYSIFIDWFTPLWLMVFSAIIFLSNTSTLIGIYLFSHLFFAFSTWVGCKGIEPDVYRYAEVYLKGEQKSEIGRLKALNKDFIRLQVRKEKECYLKIIPMGNVERIELKRLSEIETMEKERGKNSG